MRKEEQLLVYLWYYCRSIPEEMKGDARIIMDAMGLNSPGRNYELGVAAWKRWVPTPEGGGCSGFKGRVART